MKPIIKPNDKNPNKRDDLQIKDEENQKKTCSESSSKKKRMDSGSEVDDKMLKHVDHQLNTINSNDCNINDRNMNFFKSILPSLRFFDDDQILDFQSGVINLIQSIKAGRNFSNF